jgi:hypothetical protein
LLQFACQQSAQLLLLLFRCWQWGCHRWFLQLAPQTCQHVRKQQQQQMQRRRRPHCYSLQLRPLQSLLLLLLSCAHPPQSHPVDYHHQRQQQQRRRRRLRRLPVLLVMPNAEQSSDPLVLRSL